MTDLYDELGVDRDASEAEIKRAYREKARREHPDHGGDGDKFRVIALAYRTLINRETREHYDRTGSADKPRGVVENEIATMLASAFEQDRQDPIRYMQEQIDNARAMHRQEAAKFRQKAKKLGIKLRKFIETNAATRNPESRDFIASVLEDSIRNLEQQQARAEDRAELGAKMLEFLNDLRMQPESPVSAYCAAFHTTGGAGWGR